MTRYPSTRSYLGITALSVLAFVLLACSSLGLAPAQTLDQKIAYGYAQNAGVRQAAATALENHRLEVGEARAVLETTNQIRSVLDASKAATDVGDLKTAEARLALAISLLAALQQRLNQTEMAAT